MGEGAIESVGVLQKEEHVFANIYGAQESIQPGWESIPGLLKNVYKYRLWGYALLLYSKRNVGRMWDPLLELTITSSCLIVDSEVQLSSQNDDVKECFPNYSKVEQLIRKGRVRGRGEGRGGS